jgi:hypothetical protein
MYLLTVEAVVVVGVGWWRALYVPDVQKRRLQGHQAVDSFAAGSRYYYEQQQQQE